MKIFRKKHKISFDRIFFCSVIAMIFGYILTYEQSLYDQAFTELIKNEGDYVNHPSDPGGETKFGICKKYNPYIDIKNITLNFARKYYYKNFWLSMYEKIKDQRIALKLFDISINIGKKRLRDIINETLLDAVCYPNLEAVNKLATIIQECEQNNNTKSWEHYVINQINSMDSEVFLAIFKNKLINFYLSRIYTNNKLYVFRKGWIKRAIK